MIFPGRCVCPADAWAAAVCPVGSITAREATGRHAQVRLSARPARLSQLSQRGSPSGKPTHTDDTRDRPPFRPEVKMVIYE